MGTIIILYDESEELFTSLGLGVLNDCISCEVSEALNDSYELSLEYPIKGSNYSQIKIGRIIGAKPNPYDKIQPFRIASITRPINGVVTVFAYHISYDTNGIPCKAIDAASLSETLSQIKENSLIENKFTFKTDVQFARKFKTSAPYNVRALLMGDEEQSLIGVYNAELKFDKYSIYLYSKRGKNRGARVCYGNNMIDLKHESTNERLYNGVFPYYHTETESNETTSTDSFTKAYIVGSKPFQDGWLSFSKNGEPYHPVDSTPVQIDTEGEYYEKVYSWNSTYQKYEEKIYNATVTIMEGVIEPSWIVIDWSLFPVIVCRANAKGYFKLATETDWGQIKGVGDVIFQGNILTSGLTNMASNMIIGYSEVLPPNHTSSTETSVTSVDVMLDDPIIWLNTTDAKTMKYNKVLSLDLTSEFDEQPTQDKLRAKAEEYINKNLIGTSKHTTTVSFVDISSTTDVDRYSNFDHVEIGDTVKVIYKDLGVDVDLRVISTKYDAIKDSYISVELGEKPDKFSASSIQNGDNISSLSNDVGYADITTVHKLIADAVTADYLQAVNASMSKAQISYLEVAKISCPGILEASQFVLDQLVAKLLIADNAKISQTLEAGNIKVAGDISINSGSINIISEEGNTSFIVDRDGNVTANSVEITGGSILITNESGSVFEVDNDGLLTANNANISGTIIATSGEIGGAEIVDGVLKITSANIENISADKISGGTITSSQIKIGRIGSSSNYNFSVDNNGNVIARAITIVGGSINVSGGTKSFALNSDGSMEGNSVKLTGGEIGNLTIKNNLYFGSAPVTAYVRSSSDTVSHTIRFLIETQGGMYYIAEIIIVDQVTSSYAGSTLFSINELIENGYQGQADFYTQNGYSYVGPGNIYFPPTVGSYVTGEIQIQGMQDDNFYIDEQTLIESDNLVYNTQGYDWLTLTKPSTSSSPDGPVLTPSYNTVYDVYSKSLVRLGYYAWNGNKYEETSLTGLINQNGIYFPGLTSTVYSTTIAGFTVTNTTLSAVTNTTEVGMSSDTNEYAFWAGKASNGNHPFQVTHSGELFSTAGNIGSFYIGTDKLTTNVSKTSIYVNETGLMLQSDGISFYNSTSSTRVIIDSLAGVAATNILIDPFKFNVESTNPSFRNMLGTRPALLLSGECTTLNNLTSASSFEALITGPLYFYSTNVFFQQIPSNSTSAKIAIAANSTKLIKMRRIDSDLDDNTSIINVIPSVFSKDSDMSTWYYSHAPLVSFRDDRNLTYREIYIRNTNQETIYVKLLVVYVRND